VPSLAHARHLCKRLAAAHCECELVVGLWAAAPHEFADRPQDTGPRTLWVATTVELLAALDQARARSRSRAR
jgi:hypothetical protein